MRWLQADPIGLNAGPNDYEMVGNGPIGAVDPSGLFKFLGQELVAPWNPNAAWGSAALQGYQQAATTVFANSGLALVAVPVAVPAYEKWEKVNEFTKKIPGPDEMVMDLVTDEMRRAGYDEDQIVKFQVYVYGPRADPNNYTPDGKYIFPEEVIAISPDPTFLRRGGKPCPTRPSVPRTPKPKRLMRAPKGAKGIAFGLTRAEREALVASRPERFRKGVVEKVWENAKDANGKVYDPNTLQELHWNSSIKRNEQWDMGHLPGKSYDQLKQRFLNGEISRKQFLDEYNNPANYRPEAPSPNRSRRYQ
jgi:hypothetical protein